MKKSILAIALALTCVVALAACGKKKEETPTQAETASMAESKVDVAVMSYAEFDAAAIDSPVCVETYIQGNQSWWDGAARFYCQSEDGGYFIYDMACTEDECNNILTKGTKIKVTGYKSEWSGEVEITDATWEVVDDSKYIAEATDVTSLLGTDALEDYMNQYVSFKDLTIAASKDANGNEAAYLYNWDGSGKQGDDLYFNVTDANGNTYSFTVESYLTGQDTDVYKAVEALKVGDKVDMEGFLYWYEGPNPHITTVVVK